MATDVNITPNSTHPRSNATPEVPSEPTNNDTSHLNQSNPPTTAATTTKTETMNIINRFGRLDVNSKPQLTRQQERERKYARRITQRRYGSIMEKMFRIKPKPTRPRAKSTTDIQPESTTDVTSHLNLSNPTPTAETTTEKRSPTDVDRIIKINNNNNNNNHGIT